MGVPLVESTSYICNIYEVLGLGIPFWVTPPLKSIDMINSTFPDDRGSKKTLKVAIEWVSRVHG